MKHKSVTHNSSIKSSMIKQHLVSVVLTLILALGLLANVQAEESFADKKVVLQISDPNPFKQTLVLNVANNLLKYYGPDLIDVEIVAFGPGLRLLQADNANAGRIKSLANNNVKFSACKNTIKAFTKKLGHPPKLNPLAKEVDAGVVRILDLISQGYTLIKP